MNHVMLASFIDELEKIGANAASDGTAMNAFGSSVASGGKPPSLNSSSGGLKKNPMKTTNYSTMNNSVGQSATNTAAGAKDMSPPPVRS